MNVALARCLIGSGVVDPRATSVVNGKEYSLLQMTMRANLLMKPDAAQKAAFPTYFLLCHEMIAKGADPRVNLGGGITPLHVAAYYRQFYLARAMIEADADPSARTDGGKSPMAYVWMSTNNLLSVVAHIELNAQPLDHPDFSRGGVYPIEQLVRLSPTAAELWRSRNSSSTPDTLSQLRARDVLSDWNYAFRRYSCGRPMGRRRTSTARCGTATRRARRCYSDLAATRCAPSPRLAGSLTISQRSGASTSCALRWAVRGRKPSEGPTSSGSRRRR